jgi:superfamily II DNA or RNA helicase
MRFRFGLRFEAVRDWAALQEKQRQLLVGANPFDHISLCQLSYQFARQEKVLLHLERSVWDLVILDEAHHCARLGNSGYAEDSQTRKLAELLARQADGLLLLTATPHDGYDDHFASMLELLDPSLLDGRGAIRGDGYKRHVIRRLKHHIKKPGTDEPLFKQRIVEPRKVVFNTASHPRFSALHAALLSLVAPRLKQALKRRQFGDVLAFVSLLKRSVSTVRACQSTLEVIADRYAEMLEKGDEEEEARKQRLRTLGDYRRRVERYGSLSAEEEQDHALLEAEDMAAHLRLESPEKLTATLAATIHGLRLEGRRAAKKLKAADATLQSLQDLVLLAEAADEEDPKLARISEEVRAIRQREPGANVLVYTEYADSQIAVAGAIKKSVEGEVLTIEGDDGPAARATRLERFGQEDNLVLVSTDATAEGLNLHERCHHLIHVELPYNPNRLEQRNGRIDRYGQKVDPVVRYLYLAGTFEERVLLRLVAKYERQRARLTFVPNTLGLELADQGDMTAKLLDGLAEEESSLFKQEPKSEVLFQASTDENDVSSPAYQELLTEMDRAIGGFEKAAKTHAWLSEQGLNAEQNKVAEATAARATGVELGGLDLVRFVRDAVVSELRSANAVRDLGGLVLELELPPTWVHGLEDVPGWNPQKRVLLVATDPVVRTTASGEPVGFLGRAHPVVRRALDRVRNIPATSGHQTLDRRVSAVSGDGPALVYTFLCSVRSELGREFERVIAVRVTPDTDPEPLVDPPGWLSIANQNRAAPTAGVWEKRFARWSEGREEQCRISAARAFEPIARDFVAELEKELSAERQALDAWLAERTEQLCGERAQQLTFDRQLSLEDALGTSSQMGLKRVDLPAWQTSRDPVERLGSYKADSSQPPHLRGEADGVLQLYTKRVNRLDRRLHTEQMPVATLGLLLVVPGEVR